jgi:hypothetical protein
MAQLDRFCLVTFPEQTRKGELCRAPVGTGSAWGRLPEYMHSPVRPIGLQLNFVYHSTLAALTLIILFSEMWKNFKVYFFYKKFIFQGWHWIFGNVLFIKMKSQNNFLVVNDKISQKVFFLLKHLYICIYSILGCIHSRGDHTWEAWVQFGYKWHLKKCINKLSILWHCWLNLLELDIEKNWHFY